MVLGGGELGLQMKIFPFLRKESLWAKRKVGLLLLLLILLPVFFGLATESFERNVPDDIPVAVLPRNDNVPSEDVKAVKKLIAPFSDPTVSRPKSKALRLLRRERTYAVIEVPPGLMKGSENKKTFTIYVDGGMVPVQRASELIANLASKYLQDLPVGIGFELRTVGEPKTIPEFFFPSFLFLVAMILAFFYVPYNLSEDENVLERLRVDASLESVIIGKLVFFVTLAIIPLLVFYFSSLYVGASLQILTGGSVLFYLISFIYLACISMSVTFFTDFGNWGRVFNIILFFFLIIFSSMFYPSGFFGTGAQRLSELLPTSYSMIALRGFTLKGMGISSFLDWFLIILAFTVFTMLLLKGSTEYYRRKDR